MPLQPAFLTLYTNKGWRNVAGVAITSTIRLSVPFLPAQWPAPSPQMARHTPAEAPPWPQRDAVLHAITMVLQRFASKNQYKQNSTHEYAPSLFVPYGALALSP